VLVATRRTENEKSTLVTEHFDDMDPLKLLSRSTKLHKKQGVPTKEPSLPSGQEARPQLYASAGDEVKEPSSRKRKRAQQSKQDDVMDSAAPDFFGGASRPTESSKPQQDDETSQPEDEGADAGADDEEVEAHARKLLKQHKLKMTWLNPSTTPKGEKKAKDVKKEQNQHVYPRPLERFHTLRKRFGIPQRVQENVSEQGYDLATEVQMAALPLLLDNPNSFLRAPDGQDVVKHDSSYIDLLAVAPTGSGKTLAFLIPLFSKIMRLRKAGQDGVRHTTAVIVAPTKELVGQIVNEGKKLGLNTGIKISQVRKGMHLDGLSTPREESSETKEEADSSVKVDILVSTLGVLHSILTDKEEQKSGIALPAVESLVLDEADVLLDPLFRDQTLAIWNRLAHPDLRVSLWSATMGSNVEDLARSTIASRQKRLADEKSMTITEAPLVRLVVGLKDSAVPNIQHKLIYAATEQGKLMGLRQLLHPRTTSAESGPPLRPPFLVFTQTIERAVALHSELLYDIPAEAGGISRIAVLHSDLSDTARDSVMTRFRKGEVWVLITTDLLSRGVDFRGVNGVVNYDIPTSSAAYVHRVGRTGRAGREGGVAVTLYSKEDIPYMKHVATVVSMAQKQQGAAAGEGVQQWLLDALPSLSKNDKQKFKKRGVEVRTARGMASDPRGAKKARISTKAGFVRREENKKKGMIAGSKQRAKAQRNEDADDGSVFGGFD